METYFSFKSGNPDKWAGTRLYMVRVNNNLEITGQFAGQTQAPVIYTTCNSTLINFKNAYLLQSLCFVSKYSDQLLFNSNKVIRTPVNDVLNITLVDFYLSCPPALQAGNNVYLSVFINRFASKSTIVPTDEFIRPGPPLPPPIPSWNIPPYIGGIIIAIIAILILLVIGLVIGISRKTKNEYEMIMR